MIMYLDYHQHTCFQEIFKKSSINSYFHQSFDLIMMLILNLYKEYKFDLFFLLAKINLIVI